MLRFLLILTIAASLTACGAGAPVKVEDLFLTPPASAGDSWTIDFTQSGGFAGLNRTMEVHASGQAVVTDARTGRTATVQLTPEQLSKLGQLAQTAVFKPASRPSGCADCFVYTIQIDGGNGRPFTAQADDSNLGDSGLSDLVEFLRNIMETALGS